MPGTDPLTAAAVVAGELPELPHLVELPSRGIGADMIGRALAVCIDMPAEATPSGWRLTRRPGREARRARDLLQWDLDAAEQAYAGAPWLKVQVTGPWTLAAQLETPRGRRALADFGAVRDLASSLTEGLAAHLDDVARRLPDTPLAVQIDEPLLPAVLAGSPATATVFDRVAAVDEESVMGTVARVVDSLAAYPTIAHCCHPDVPVDLLRRAGFGAVSMDMTSFAATADTSRLDVMGEAVEAGTVLLAGLVPTGRPATPIDFHAVADPLLGLWHRLGLAPSNLARVVVTPTCGLAGATDAWVREALDLARNAARLVAERSEGN